MIGLLVAGVLLARLTLDSTKRAIDGPPTTAFVFDPRSYNPPPGPTITGLVRVIAPAGTVAGGLTTDAGPAASVGSTSTTPPSAEPRTDGADAARLAAVDQAAVDQPAVDQAPPTFEPRTIGDVTVSATTIIRAAGVVNFQFEFTGPTAGEVAITWTDTVGVAPATRSFSLGSGPYFGHTVSLGGLIGTSITITSSTAGGHGELLIPVT